MALEIGAVFPTCEIGSDPAAIRDYAQAAEALGYSHLITYDHVLGAEHAGRDPKLMGPYTEGDAFHEPMVLYGFLAACTKKLQLATGVLILPQRQTALVAKQAAELALLSEGRFILGVGSGWNWVEYEALNEDYASRGARLSEQVEVLRELWSKPLVDFEGDHHRIARANLLPRPTAEIPIWFGGFSEPAIRRAARLGDGFLFGLSSPPMQRLCETLNEALAQNGRAEGFAIDAITHFSAGRDGWRSQAETWSGLGATHFSVNSMDTAASLLGNQPVGFKGVEDHIRGLEDFIETVRDIG